MNSVPYNLLIAVIFIIPIITGLMMVLRKKSVSSIFLRIQTVVLTAGLIGLMMLGEREITTNIKFMGEVITLSVHYKPILLFIITLLILLAFTSIDRRVKNEGISVFSFTLINLSLSFGFLAFISGQFMIRYIALDIVGLMASLAAIHSKKPDQDFNDFRTIFLILRLGDLSLLVSILLVNAQVGSLDINQIINFVSSMSPPEQVLALSGFLLAILIKIGAWPFGYWIQRARKSKMHLSFWIPGFLMPVLGYYLLYRVTPIILIHPTYQILVFGIGLVGILGIIVLNWVGWVKFDRLIFLGSISSGVILCASALFGSGFIVRFIAGVLIYRLIISLDQANSMRVPRAFHLIFPAIWQGTFLLFYFNDFSIVRLFLWIILVILWSLGGWMVNHRKQTSSSKYAPLLTFDNLPELTMDSLTTSVSWLNLNFERVFTDVVFSGRWLVKTAQFLNRKVEIGILSKGVVKLASFFNFFAKWNRDMIENSLEKAWTWVGKKLVSISEGAFSVIEVEAAQKTDDVVEDALLSLEGYEKRVLKKRLRLDLIWIPILMVGIVLFILLI